MKNDQRVEWIDQIKSLIISAVFISARRTNFFCVCFVVVFAKKTAQSALGIALKR